MSQLTPVTVTTHPAYGAGCYKRSRLIIIINATKLIILYSRKNNFYVA